MASPVPAVYGAAVLIGRMAAEPGLPQLGPWFERVAARPSAAASRQLLTELALA